MSCADEAVGPWIISQINRSSRLQNQTTVIFVLSAGRGYLSLEEIMSCLTPFPRPQSLVSSTTTIPWTRSTMRKRSCFLCSLFQNTEWKTSCVPPGLDSKSLGIRRTPASIPGFSKVIPAQRARGEESKHEIVLGTITLLILLKS